MPIQPDPRYFDFANSFFGGQQQAQENNRRNAMVGVDQKHAQMREQQMLMQQDEYLRSIQASKQNALKRQQMQPLLEKALIDEGASPEVAMFLSESDGAEELFAELMQMRMNPPAQALIT